jgi:hypothetical protein
VAPSPSNPRVLLPAAIACPSTEPPVTSPPKLQTGRKDAVCTVRVGRAEPQNMPVHSSHAACSSFLCACSPHQHRFYPLAGSSSAYSKKPSLPLLLLLPLALETLGPATQLQLQFSYTTTRCICEFKSL